MLLSVINVADPVTWATEVVVVEEDMEEVVAMGEAEVVAEAMEVAEEVLLLMYSN